MRGLPQGWAAATLGDVAVTQLGKMLSQKASAGLSPHPYLRNKNVQWGRFDLADIAEMDFTQDELTRFEVRRGDLLVCEGGEVGRAAIWQGQIAPIGFQKALHRVRPYAGVEPQLLLYQLMWLAQTNALDPFVTGSTIKHLPQEDLRTLPIFVPPMNEQRRIVASIEEQFSRLDAATNALSQASKLVDGLRWSALGQPYGGLAPIVALGDLVPDDRPICYGILKPRTTGELRVPYVEVRSIRDGRIDVASLHKTTVALHEEFHRSELRDGDVVLAIRGSFDRAAVVPAELTGANVSRDVARITPGPEIQARYLALYLSGPHARAFFASHARGVGVRGINIGDLRRMPVPTPPLAQQQRIVSELDQRLSVLDSIRGAIDAGLRRSATLRRSLLERAFRGELVPQDPSDEPAAILLERIRAERADQPPRRRTRSRAGSAPPA